LSHSNHFAFSEQLISSTSVVKLAFLRNWGRIMNHRKKLRSFGQIPQISRMSWTSQVIGALGCGALRGIL
jgi:hypothetical protein